MSTITAFAFILGAAVFFGMAGVRMLGLFFTPVSYVALRPLTRKRAKKAA